MGYKEKSYKSLYNINKKSNFGLIVFVYFAQLFGAMKPAQGYKTQTMVTLVEGIAAMAGVFILSLIF
jgi:hypothetical protein